MATIGIEGMQFYAYHGVYDHERENGGEYLVDIYVETDISQAAHSDNVADAVDYEKIFSITQKMMENASNLLEKVCTDLLEKIVHDTRGIEHIKVRVTKLYPPIQGKVERVFVESSKQILS